ncbi:uncharacterized protein FIESC28_11138 [Fusarium coffeatum]|uniref:Uncharacterized protein n=1 Tax=Fusarium coffeatum TaxID=231269 RepID=A0A366QPM6_9HYPO|nr:uncharacterized protein FIESC28_11138 [Fusarium coffeatum]RBR06228.1 hypothetical protein FIESC28_11138 [Fusarium coffeatum]
MESSRQNLTPERVLESGQAIEQYSQSQLKGLMEVFATISQYTCHNEDLVILGEMEVTKRLAKAKINSGGVRQNTVSPHLPSTQCQDVAAEATETIHSLAGSKCASGQYCGPFIPHPRHYSRIHATNVILEKGSLFNPTGVIPGSEMIWQNDAWNTAKTIFHSTFNGEVTMGGLEHVADALRGALYVTKVLRAEDGPTPEVGQIQELELRVQELSNSTHAAWLEAPVQM